VSLRPRPGGPLRVRSAAAPARHGAGPPSARPRAHPSIAAKGRKGSPRSGKMWVFGLASAPGWLLSGASDGSLVCWEANPASLESALQAKAAEASSSMASHAEIGPQTACSSSGDAEQLAATAREGGGAAEPAAEGQRAEPWNRELLSRCVAAHSNPIYDVKTCAEGTIVFTGADEEIRVWREPWAGAEPVAPGAPATNVQPVAELRIPQLEGSRLALSPVAETNGLAPVEQGRKLVAAAGDSLAYLFDVQSQKLVRNFAGHKDYLHAVAAVERTGLIATGSEDGTCMLWDARAPAAVTTLVVGEIASALCVSDDGNWLAIGGAAKGAGCISLCHLATRVPMAQQRCKSGMVRVNSLVFTPTNLVAGGHGSSLEYWTVNNGEHQVSVRTSNASVYSLAYDPSVGTLAAAGSSPIVDVFSAERSQMFALCC